MLSKAQLKKQIAGIREYVISEVGLSAGQIKAALENAEALEELLSLREQLAAIKGTQEPVGFVKCDPCAEDCRWDCVDPIYLAGPVTPEGYGSDYFEVYRHPAPLKE
ncbi:hypothetical protein [Yersinia enterocolitica]|uniref:hypothetical protein n=1 Tax=Yersinia enterocolitica TaxID=630 RepID=UPI003D7B2E8C